MHALVLADGDRPRRPALDGTWPDWDADADLVVAADGGAQLADDLGVSIDLWVGDGDSLPPAALATLEDRGVPLQRAAVDKDESDAELAILAALERGATSLTILGALGGRRIDHALANVALLAHPALGDRVGARLIDETTRISLVAAGRGEVVKRTLVGRIGDVVTLLAFGDLVGGVTTDGLRYPLADEPLAAGVTRGLSNVRVAEVAAVTVRDGRLLVVETAATLAR